MVKKEQQTSITCLYYKIQCYLYIVRTQEQFVVADERLKSEKLESYKEDEMVPHSQSHYI